MAWKPDETILNLSIPTGLTGVEQIQKCLADATEEVKTLVKYECEIIFECRVCRNMFRSLANFTAHKRIYCKIVSASQHGSQAADISQSPESETNNPGKSRSGHLSREPTPVSELKAQLLSDASNDSSDEVNAHSSAHSRLLTKPTGKVAVEHTKRPTFNFYGKLVKRIEAQMTAESQSKGTAAVVMQKVMQIVPKTIIQNGVQMIEDRQATVNQLAPKTVSTQKVVMVLPEEPNAGKHITSGMILRARANPGDPLTSTREVTEEERKVYERMANVAVLDLKNLSCLAANDCSKRFASLEALACHFTFRHSTLLPVAQCLVCGQEFSIRQEVLIHAASEHREVMQEELNEAFAEEMKLMEEEELTGRVHFATKRLPQSKKRPAQRRMLGKFKRIKQANTSQQANSQVEQSDTDMTAAEPIDDGGVMQMQIDDRSTTEDARQQRPDLMQSPGLPSHNRLRLIQQSSTDQVDHDRSGNFQKSVQSLNGNKILADQQLPSVNRTNSDGVSSTSLPETNSVETENVGVRKVFKVMGHMASKISHMDEMNVDKLKEDSDPNSLIDSDAGEELKLNLSLDSTSSASSNHKETPFYAWSSGKNTTHRRINALVDNTKHGMPRRVIPPVGMESSEESSGNESPENLSAVRKQLKKSLTKTVPPVVPLTIPLGLNGLSASESASSQVTKPMPNILRKKVMLKVRRSVANFAQTKARQQQKVVKSGAKSPEPQRSESSSHSHSDSEKDENAKAKKGNSQHGAHKIFHSQYGRHCRVPIPSQKKIAASEKKKKQPTKKGVGKLRGKYRPRASKLLAQMPSLEVEATVGPTTTAAPTAVPRNLPKMSTFNGMIFTPRGGPLITPKATRPKNTASSAGSSENRHLQHAVDVSMLPKGSEYTSSVPPQHTTAIAQRLFDKYSSINKSSARAKAALKLKSCRISSERSPDHHSESDYIADEDDNDQSAPKGKEHPFEAMVSASGRKANYAESAITYSHDEQPIDECGTSKSFQRPVRARRHPRYSCFDPEEYETEFPGIPHTKRGAAGRPSSESGSATEVSPEAKAPMKPPRPHPIVDFDKDVWKGIPANVDSGESDKVDRFGHVLKQLIDPIKLQCLICKRLCRNLRYAKEHCVSHIQAFRFKCSACAFKAYAKQEVSTHVFNCPTRQEKLMKDVGLQPHIIAIHLESNANYLLKKFAKDPAETLLPPPPVVEKPLKRKYVRKPTPYQGRSQAD